MPPQQTQRRLICLLGMHRSGTSFLAGELAQAGLFLGNANQAGSPFNAKGNQENQSIVVFHETVLKAAGGSWREPPASIHWEPRHRERALQLANEYPADRLCGFKDPRTLLHLHEWQSLPLPLQLVGIFRQPQAVADSLFQRDGMPNQDALTLWQTYNQKLLDAWRQQPFPLIDFDLAPEALKRTLQQTAEYLGLPDSNKTGFFEDALRHQQASPAEAGHPAWQLHQQLQEAAESFWAAPGATTASN